MLQIQRKLPQNHHKRKISQNRIQETYLKHGVLLKLQIARKSLPNGPIRLQKDFFHRLWSLKTNETREDQPFIFYINIYSFSWNWATYCKRHKLLQIQIFLPLLKSFLLEEKWVPQNPFRCLHLQVSGSNGKEGKYSE